ncbi:hypothetical protein GQ42DRAFT_162364 [Ramicandelaber brevisporus]|nr:hypothetical protein GQ42DRAFT_162364 [Ramicandelaber brevisporus]
MASLVESLIHIHLSDESFGRVQSPCNCSIKHREWFKDGDGILWQHSNIRLVILYYIKLVRLMYGTQ